MRREHLSIPVLGAGLVAAGLALSAPAAGRISSAGTTLWTGTARGGNTGEGPGTMSGPVVPYPCAYDWYCDDNGFGITFGAW